MIGSIHLKINFLGTIDLQCAAFVKMKLKDLVRIWWRNIDINNFIMGCLAITRWTGMCEKLKNKYPQFDYMNTLQ